MGTDLNEISILTRREIEARIAGPIIIRFIEAFGKEKTMKIVSELIEDLAKQSGEELKEFTGGNSMEHYLKGMELWSKDDAYELQIIEKTETNLSINITRCKYAEMYEEIGLKELGLSLSCGRDFALMEGFNPEVKMTRTQTIMEGAEHCDFRYVFPGADKV
ncbi:MAG: L-2-amino-thiazoline-4-carboxylic acid hydrolase [bacterium]|nr:L-2-amino-thiazoline-4-carboxylic acid hydrolase [bacterium]